MFRRVVLKDLPWGFRGFCYENFDGEYVCILNAKYSSDQLLRTYKHELKHVENPEDFTELNISEVENIRHMR